MKREFYLFNKTKTLLLAIFLLPIITFSQGSQLSVFNNLVNKTWKAEGNWSNGTKFKQEIEVKFSLDSTLVISNSKGFIDNKKVEFGPRNHGIRMYDKESDTIKFWDFDIFGALTEGIILAEEKNIIYQYAYGDLFLTEMWEYLNDSSYNFKIGIFENGVWKELYLTTQFVVITEK